MSKKYWPTLYSMLLYKMDQDFLDIHYLERKPESNWMTENGEQEVNTEHMYTNIIFPKLWNAFVVNLNFNYKCPFFTRDIQGIVYYPKNFFIILSVQEL